MALINGIKIKTILNGLNLRRNLKSMLSKIHGHLRPKILNDLGVSESNTRLKQRSKRKQQSSLLGPWAW